MKCVLRECCHNHRGECVKGKKCEEGERCYQFMPRFGPPRSNSETKAIIRIPRREV